MCLLTQVHTSFLVQCAEVWIPQVFDETDGFSGTFHLGSQLFVYTGEFFKTEHGLFNGITIELLVHLEFGEFGRAQHYFGSDVQVRDLVSFSNERRGAGGPGVGFDHIYFAVFDGKLYVDKTFDIE